VEEPVNVRPANDQVDSIFERYAKSGSPGCALVVMKEGKVVYQQGYGLANLEHGVPVLPSTVFNIGSMAKQFTAFTIALLEAKGKLSLDDDVRKHLPEMHDFGHTITLHHLIHHTSGLRCTFPELLALAEWRDTDATSTEDVHWLLRAQRELNFRPGDEFMYSNSNYILLALICERVSGQPFAAFCQERIFGPLGMTRSCVNDSITKIIPGRALGYYDDGQGNWLNAPLTDSVVGPTNVYTTVEDLIKWDENFYTGQVGGQAVIERIQQPGHLNDGTELDYAFGLMVGPAHRHRGWQVVEHGGGQGGYGSWMMRFPELHLSVVVLFNHFLWNMQDYAFRIADVFVEERAAPEGTGAEQVIHEGIAAPVELSAEQIEKKVGVYFGAQRAAVREIRCAEGRLQFQGYDLVPLSENLFFFEVEPQTRVEFMSAMDGTVAGMKTISGSEEYAYARVKTVSPTPNTLAQYAGRYYSPELDIYWTIEASDNHLIGKRRKYVDSKLTPVFGDAFSDDWEPLMGYPTTYLIVFERDERGMITGLRVSGTRVRNLRFTRQRA
jgi:CubicO group peptidase (beta-lactamase class C family)